MVGELATMSTANLIIVAVTILIIFFGILAIILKRGIKASLGGKTIEVSGRDGEVQQTDQFGLMYILSDNCKQIEDRKKERIDAIIQSLSYRINEISNLSCINLKAESLLQNRRRQNGFTKLATRKLFDDYVADVAGELFGKLSVETRRIVTCTTENVHEIEKSVIQSVSQAFALKAISTCRDEYEEKSEMYQRFLPQFLLLKDTPRVEFCKQKISKHNERVRIFNELIKEIEK